MTGFIKLTHPQYLKNWMGLQMAEGKESKFGDGYYCVEIPLAATYAEPTPTPLGKFVELTTAATVTPKKSRVMVSVNPVLLAAGLVNTPSIVEPSDGETQIKIQARFTREVDLSKLTWAVRLYLMD